MKENTRVLLSSTRKNMLRNRWLSISTIFVISIVFTISSFFIALAMFSKKAVQFYETKAQVIVFFKKEAPEEEIFKFRDLIENKELIESIEYTSQEEALEIYKEDFQDEPELLETITAETLPPSLNIRAKSIEDLNTVIKSISSEKEKNAYVDEILYFKDVVDNMRTLSKVINYGAAVLITSLSAITFALIMITIGFNIMAHKDEIEIMHLVGSSDKFIKVPFLLEGSLYGAIGAIVSSTLLILPWYVALLYMQNTDFYFWISQLLSDLSLGYLKEFNLSFVLLFYGIQIFIGVAFGFIGSYSAVLKYLRLKEE